MKAATTAIAAGTLVVGAAIGAAGGYYYARHRFVAALEQVTSALATPVGASPVSTAVSAPSVDNDVSKTTWDVSSHTDAISGWTSWYVAGISRESQTTMVVRCGLAPGSFDLSVFGDQMTPNSDGSGGDEYFVSYRFDNKPGVSLQQWFGSGHSTSPYPTVEDSFFRALAQSKSLIMRIGSTVMDAADAQLPDQHFDLAGYDAAVAKLQPHCTGITARTATP